MKDLYQYHPLNTNGFFTLKESFYLKSKYRFPTNHGIYACGQNTIANGQVLANRDNIGVNALADAVSLRPITLVDGSYISMGSPQGYITYMFLILISSDGKMWGVGSGNSYVFGNNSSNNLSSITQIGTDTNWAKVFCGSASSFAIKTDGTLWTCGSNSNYQTGRNTNTGATQTWTQVGTDTWTTIAGGYNGAYLGITTSGKLYGWGGNTSGANGSGLTTGSTTVPTQVGTDTDWVDCTMISSILNATSIMRKTNGLLYSMGSNANFQTGLNTSAGNTLTPTNMSATLTFNKIIGGGTSHGMAIHTDGSLYGWGSGGAYKFGNGSTSNLQVPTKIGTATNWVECCAIDSGNIVYNSLGDVYIAGTIAFYPFNTANQTFTKIGTIPNTTKMQCCGSNKNLFFLVP